MVLGGNAIGQTSSAADSALGNIQGSATSQTNPDQSNLTNNIGLPTAETAESSTGFNWGWLGLLGLLGLFGLRNRSGKNDLYKKESTIVTHH